MEEKDVLFLLLMIFLHIVIFILSTLKMNYMINLKIYKILVENQLDDKIKNLRLDRGVDICPKRCLNFVINMG